MPKVGTNHINDTCIQKNGINRTREVINEMNIYKLCG